MIGILLTSSIIVSFRNFFNRFIILEQVDLDRLGFETIDFHQRLWLHGP